MKNISHINNKHREKQKKALENPNQDTRRDDILIANMKQTPGTSSQGFLEKGEERNLKRHTWNKLEHGERLPTNPTRNLNP